MKKRKGSILIEVMASVLMLSFAGIFMASSIFKCFKEYENRVREEKINMVANMLVKEIKFNISSEELEEIFCDGSTMSIKYDDNLCEKMSYTNIMDLESGNDIKIQKMGDDNFRSNYKISICLNDDNFNIEKREYEFYKSWWMDEV